MLNHSEYNTLAELRDELRYKSKDVYDRGKVLQCLRLIQKEGPKGKRELEQLMQETGTSNLEELTRNITPKSNEN